MSDDDFMCDSDEDYDLEYSDDEEEDEEDSTLENQYYNSKATKEESLKEALDGFAKVITLQSEKGEWGFKALKQMLKINFKLGNYDDMMVHYRELLTYIKSAVTRNHSEKSINSILDYVSVSKNMVLLQELYETTLNALQEAKNERLWFKTNTKLGKLYFDLGEYGQLQRVIKQLHAACKNQDGSDDQKKGTQLLEIYALEIQMYTEQKNNKKLKALYEQSLQVKSAIPHPLIMGVIRECGGKMHLRDAQYQKAHTDFFEAFKNYDESGSPRRTACLKYLVLASMLMKSNINPFDSQEAKPYKNDKEIIAMTNLVNAYQSSDIEQFQAIIKEHHNSVMGDTFIREHIEDLLKNIRTEVLVKVIKPYTRLKIDFVANVLGVSNEENKRTTLPDNCARINELRDLLEVLSPWLPWLLGPPSSCQSLIQLVSDMKFLAEVEQLLIGCILDGAVKGKIDQLSNTLVLDKEQAANKLRMQSLSAWTKQINELSEKLHVTGGVGPCLR